MASPVPPLGKALSDPARVRILGVLRDGEWCGCHLAQLLGLAPATVSRHIAQLRRAGLVSARKQGRWLHCALASPKAGSPQAGLLDWLRRTQAGDPARKADLRRLKELARGCGPACCP